MRYQQTTTPQIAIPRERIADRCRRWKIAELSFFGSVYIQEKMKWEVKLKFPLLPRAS